MTIKEVLNEARKLLTEYNIEDSGLIAKMLLAHILSCKKEELIIKYDSLIDEKKLNEFLNGIEKIKNGYPIQYLTQKKEFMKMEFTVNENVLIPRQDTEILVEESIKIAKDGYKILDLCTGSGAIRNITCKIQKKYTGNFI